ncbi:hypothetical protein GQ53DRAFT_818138 [Thozetella sp. PMI_491]|nr:hypothetical protein GQ53DRAFT_818138 [Thozetella sp. PMI_491]
MFPPGLDALYGRMMDQICSLEDGDDVELCQRILAVASIVYQPITLDELTSLVDIPSVCGGDDTIMEVIGLCGSYLTVRDRTIFFVHQSAKDFLLQSACNIFPSGPENLHYTIFSRSLQAMSVLRRDIYNLKAPGLPIEQAQARRPDPDPLAAVRYSCVYWIDHLFHSRVKDTEKDLQDNGAIDNFLHGKYLYWLEALSLLKSVSHSVLSMIQLERLVQGHSHFVTSIAWSTDGRLASGSDKTIKIWDPTTGQCTTTLEGHSHFVTSIAWSTNGRLASGSYDKTIKIWDPTTGQCTRTLEIGYIPSLKFDIYTPQYLYTNTERLFTQTPKEQTISISLALYSNSSKVYVVPVGPFDPEEDTTGQQPVHPGVGGVGIMPSNTDNLIMRFTDPGAALNDSVAVQSEVVSPQAWEKMNAATKMDILAQISQTFKLIQDCKLPVSVKGYGGLGFANDGSIVVSPTPINGATGACDAYHELYTQRVDLPISSARSECSQHADISRRNLPSWTYGDIVAGWENTNLRSRRDAFVAKGFEPLLKEASRPNAPQTLVHGDFDVQNFLFDPGTRRLVGLLDFIFSHVASAADEYLYSFPSLGGLLIPPRLDDGLRRYLLHGFEAKALRAQARYTVERRRNNEKLWIVGNIEET